MPLQIWLKQKFLIYYSRNQKEFDMKFKINRCPKCGRTSDLMFSNNPLSGETICFSCIDNQLDYNNIEHAEFFCRSYNLPWMPELWLNLVQNQSENPWREYTSLVLDDKNNQPNLSYQSTTQDLWNRTNKEWEKCRSFQQILLKLKPIHDSYLDRGHLKWGDQYTFEELIQLDSVYSRTLKANNITNPLQKEAVKALCKINIEINQAIREKDAKAMKDYSTAYATFAKQADLEGMINDTKTDDITTVAELYDYMEKQGFQFKFYDGYDRDEVDRTIKDIQDTNRRLILECTGLQPQLEEMMRQKMRTLEETQAKAAATEEGHTLQDLLNFEPEDGEIATEDDSDALNTDFTDTGED